MLVLTCQNSFARQLLTNAHQAVLSAFSITVVDAFVPTGSTEDRITLRIDARSCPFSLSPHDIYEEHEWEEFLNDYGLELYRHQQVVKSIRQVAHGDRDVQWFHIVQSILSDIALDDVPHLDFAGSDGTVVRITRDDWHFGDTPEQFFNKLDMINRARKTHANDGNELAKKLAHLMLTHNVSLGMLAHDGNHVVLNPDTEYPQAINDSYRELVDALEAFLWIRVR